MNQKRSRSVNWDEEEKQLFRCVLKEYAHIIENKSSDTNTNKNKSKAWEEVHKKFNELNGRHRQLNQLKIQWKMMKVNARKSYSTFQREASKTGGGARPASPNDGVIEIKDLLNPAELLKDHNIYDSDSIMPSTSTEHRDTILPSTTETCTITLKDSLSLPLDFTVKDVSNEQNQNITDILYIETTKDVEDQVETLEFTPSTNVIDDAITATPMRNMIATLPVKKVPKRKVINNMSEKSFKFSKDHNDYVSSMVRHSSLLKEQEHKRRQEMAEEEHTIKMAIHKEKLKCAILEREILQIKKEHELNNH